MTKERKKFRPLTSSDVFEAYNALFDEGLIPFPITPQAESRVEAIVANVSGSYFGRELYSTAEEKVVAYLYFLINDHPFTDGNKRTATTAFAMACALNGLLLKKDEYPLDELAVFMERIADDHHEVIRRFAGLLFN